MLDQIDNKVFHAVLIKCTCTVLLLPAAAWLTGEYGVKNLYVGVPVIIGSKGVERIVEVKFSPEERSDFRKSVKAVENLVKITKKLQRESGKKAN